MQETSLVLGQSKSIGKKIKDSNKEDTTYAEKENFSGRHFTNANFSDKRFGQFANFDSTVFDRYADFEEIDAPKGISFKHVLFKKDFSFYRGGDFNVNFKNSTFLGEALFERFTFIDTVDFSNCTFESKVSFKDVGFDAANFSNLHLTEKTEFNFYDSRVVNKLDFSFNPKIYNEIRLIDALYSEPNLFANDTAKSPPPCLINLYKSDISKFYLDYIHFKLYFPDYFDSFYSDSSKITSYEKQIIYESLLNNFKNHDQLDSYKLLDIEYRSFKYDIQGHWFYKWLDHYWWNFGYNKEYIFKWTFGFIVFFSLINLFLLKRVNKNVYTIKSIPNSFKPFVRVTEIKYVRYNLENLWNRYWFALVYTSAIFFMITIKLDNFKFYYKLQSLYIIIVYTIGLICLAYMANFILHK